MTDSFQDKFNRVDGPIGAGYTIPCGTVQIFDEAVLPVDVDLVNGSEVLETPMQRTQVLYTAAVMDNPDQMIRTVWGHDNVIPAGVSSPPSFTILARATKDPLLIDLTPPDESPDCYDQFYGVRVTCPLSGAAPVLKIIKKMPRTRVTALSNPTSTEEDFAQVLASVTIPVVAMNVDPAWDQTGDYPYRGFWQDMRIRVRRGDNEVIIDAYLNDRFETTPILTFTDYQDPLWSIVGVPGFEFLSAVLTNQPSAASPFAQEALALMRCSLFSAQTIIEFRRPNVVQPRNTWTYDRVVDRVITLVEKDGESVYTSSNAAGNTKRDVYLGFVMEAESDLIRSEGYYQWLKRTRRITLVDEQITYEIPEDVGEIQLIRPGNFVAGPLREMDNWAFHQAIAGRSTSGGKPSVYILDATGPNNRPTIRLFPGPLVASIDTTDPTVGPYLEIDYYARQIFPSEPSMQMPFVPQEDMDVLIYAAAAHATTLDTDQENAERMANLYMAKKNQLRRKNNRKTSGRQTIFMTADVAFNDSAASRVPLLRATQLNNFLL